jgi:uncharacterized oligopeptide transporter (OPT) family protein
MLTNSEQKYYSELVEILEKNQNEVKSLLEHKYHYKSSKPTVDDVIKVWRDAPNVVDDIFYIRYSKLNYAIGTVSLISGAVSAVGRIFSSVSKTAVAKQKAAVEKAKIKEENDRKKQRNIYILIGIVVLFSFSMVAFMVWQAKK